MSIELYLAYVLACIVITIVPGPTVTLIVANSLTYGSRAGLLNVAGTQLGLGLMLVVLLVGLASIIATMGFWFDWLRLAGAAYLIWLGIKLLRSSGAIEQPGSVPAPRGGFFLQGFLVLMGNPKALLWFGAFIPQFVDPKGDYVGQVVLLGAHRHGGRGAVGRRLCGGDRARQRAPVAQPRPPGQPHRRALPDRRRRLARAHPRPLTDRSALRRRSSQRVAGRAMRALAAHGGMTDSSFRPPRRCPIHS